MKKLTVQLFLFGYLLIASGCSAYSSDMSGTVIDAETGKPLEGAVVLVEWTKTKGIGLTHTESFKVQEILTDNNGQFTVSGVSDPFVNAPDVTVYKKGYVAWNNKFIFPDYARRVNFQWKTQLVFPMEKFNEGYIHENHVSFLRTCINSSLNLETKKQIFAAFEWERDFALREGRKRGQ